MVKHDLKQITAQFFTSRVRYKIMSLFYTSPSEFLHMRKIARDIGEQINAVRRELISMEKTEFLISKKDGIRKYYTINPDFAFYNEFRSTIMKSYGVGYYLFKNRRKLGNIRYAILTHTYLNREKSDAQNLDLLIVGEPHIETLQECIKEAENVERREIFYYVISEKELEINKRRRDPLIYSLTVLPKAMIIGREEDFVIN